jgi:hypothetical protein
MRKLITHCAKKIREFPITTWQREAIVHPIGHAPHLFVHGLNVRRQQSAQTERVAFRQPERRPFVENRMVQPVNAPGRPRAAGLGFFCAGIDSNSVFVIGIIRGECSAP